MLLGICFCFNKRFSRSSCVNRLAGFSAKQTHAQWRNSDRLGQRLTSATITSKHVIFIYIHWRRKQRPHSQGARGEKGGTWRFWVASLAESQRKERERGLHIKQHPLTQCRLCQVGGGEGPRWNARGGERQDEREGWRRNGGRRGASQREESHQNRVLMKYIGEKKYFTHIG